EAPTIPDLQAVFWQVAMREAFKLFLYRYVPRQIMLAVIMIVGVFAYGFLATALHFSDAENAERDVAAAYPSLLVLGLGYSIALAAILAKRERLALLEGIAGCYLGNLIVIILCWPLIFFVGHAFELASTLSGGLAIGASVTAAFVFLASY